MNQWCRLKRLGRAGDESMEERRKITLCRRRRVGEPHRANLAPVLDGLVGRTDLVSVVVESGEEADGGSSKGRARRWQGGPDGSWPRGRSTYQAAQVLAPATFCPVLVKVVHEHDEDDENADECAGSTEPPGPPERPPTLEEADGALDEARESRLGVGRHGPVRRLALAYPLAERARRVQETYAKDETHEEATDMREVVEPREQTEDEADDDVEHDVRQLLQRRASFPPLVQQVEQVQREDAEEAA